LREEGNIMLVKVSSLLIGLGAATVFCTAASGEIIRFTLTNHPRGEAIPPAYGMRMDDLLGESDFATTFSFEGNGASVAMEIDTDLNTIRIHGTVFGGIDGGMAHINPELYTLDMTYSIGVTGDAVNGWSVGMLGNTGTFVRQSDSKSWDLTTVFNNMNHSFEFFPDRYRLEDGDLPGAQWVGRGWLDTALVPRPGSTRDFLFVATLVPLPGGVWMGLAGLAGVGAIQAVRRRRVTAVE
jgi:hypothetical protein